MTTRQTHNADADGKLFIGLMIFFTLLVGTLLALALAGKHEREPRDVTPRTSATPVPNRPLITHTGPRLGFDGKIHLLPGMTPGIGF